MTSPEPHTPWPKAVAMGVIGAVIVSLVVLAFLWPSMTSKPKDLPVDVVASEQVFEQFTSQAGHAAEAQGQDLPFEFNRVGTRDEAVDAIEARDVYGAFVLPSAPGGKMEVLTAKAANTQVATMLSSTADGMVAAQAAQLPAGAPADQRIAALQAAAAGGRGHRYRLALRG